MAALTAAANRQAMGSIKGRIRIPVKAATQIWKGAIVQTDAGGFAQPAVAGAGAPVMGIAAESKLGGATDGANFVEVEYGRAYRFAASSITQAMIGDPMLVIDDNTVDETSAGSPAVGELVEFISTTEGWVYVPGPSA
jgi:hypothetical protein